MTSKATTRHDLRERAHAIVPYILMFFAFSLAGWLYETADNAVAFGGIWLRAALILPWCPIYGIGGIIMILVTDASRAWTRSRSASRIVDVTVSAMVTALVAVIVELAGSYVCEAAFGVVPWDYSDAWLNFDGRIAPRYTMRFVVLGLVATYGVAPSVRRFAETKPNVARTIAMILVMLGVADCAGELLGLWSPVKDTLGVLGVRHW